MHRECGHCSVIHFSVLLLGPNLMFKQFSRVLNIIECNFIWIFKCIKKRNREISWYREYNSNEEKKKRKLLCWNELRRSAETWTQWDFYDFALLMFSSLFLLYFVSYKIQQFHSQQSHIKEEAKKKIAWLISDFTVDDVDIERNEAIHAFFVRSVHSKKTLLSQKYKI